MNCHVDIVCGKVRTAAARIRARKSFNVHQKKLLYFAWVHSAMIYAGPVNLPFMTTKQKAKLQVATNCAVRAIYGLKSSYSSEKVVSATALRKKTGILSVESITQEVIAKQTWLRRHEMRPLEEEQVHANINRRVTRHQKRKKDSNTNRFIKYSII